MALITLAMFNDIAPECAITELFRYINCVYAPINKIV